MSKYEVTEIYEPKDNSNHWLMQLLARPIAYHRIFAILTGSVTAGVMLSQAFYWSNLPSVQKRGGWFYKSATEWEEETCLSVQEQRTARKRLSNFNWWQEDIRKANGAPTIHYRINLAVFTKELAQFAQQMDMLPATNGYVASNKSDMLPATNPINREYTESTTETTTTGGGDTLTPGDIFAAYENNIGFLTPMLAESIKSAMEDYPLQWIVDAIAIAVDANVRKWSYVNGILKRWEVDGKQDKQEKCPTVEVIVDEDTSWTRS